MINHIIRYCQWTRQHAMLALARLSESECCQVASTRLCNAKETTHIRWKYPLLEPHLFSAITINHLPHFSFCNLVLTSIVTLLLTKYTSQDSMISAGILPQLICLAVDSPYDTAEMSRKAARTLANLTANLDNATIVIKVGHLMCITICLKRFGDLYFIWSMIILESMCDDSPTKECDTVLNAIQWTHTIHLLYLSWASIFNLALRNGNNSNYWHCITQELSPKIVIMWMNTVSQFRDKTLKSYSDQAASNFMQVRNHSTLYLSHFFSLFPLLLHMRIDSHVLFLPSSSIPPLLFLWQSSNHQQSTITCTNSPSLYCDS